MLTMLWLPILVSVVVATFLITGRAFNPLTGFQPTFVRRDTMPRHYWSSVALWVAFLLLTLWFQ